ncbi:MAG TPA: sulfatase-like hydrolase/transferase [Burkholderiaceae bacterium]|nr:sulfatase-like hydrolase/transferase [Burkholderiaceae bacterium]
MTITMRGLATLALVSIAMTACRSPEPEALRRSGAAEARPVAGEGRSAATGSVQSSAATQPNIVVIVADDLGYADVSTYHPGRIPTPNIDRIGREGVVFTQGYASAPICSPSRAGLITGRHQQRFGFEYNNGPAVRDISQRLGIDPRERTVADALRGAGYRTGAIGKWHLGSAPEFYPMNRGFDEFWGFLTGQTNFIRPDAPGVVNAQTPSPVIQAGELVRPAMRVNPANAVVTGAGRQRVDLGDGLLTEQITEQAIDFIERHRSRPFFLYLAHHAPHTPLQVTQKYFDRFPAIADRTQRVYAGMVSALDDGVGAVLDRLQSLGLADNTIVVFLSDNGCAAYIPNLCSAQPLSGGKLTYLEGGVRIPFLVRWPARLKPGSRHEGTVSTLDVFPTLVKAAGATLPADRTYDGSDLMAQLAAGSAGGARPLFWRTDPIHAMREGDWKYLKLLDGSQALYRLSDDPRETRNLASSEVGRVSAMRERYRAWEADKVPPKWSSRATTFEFDGRTFQFTP